jgi:phenylacetate-CoA ligase
MPLIRYEIGDEITLDAESCSCGRSLPLMKCVDGRHSDFLDLPGGKRVSPREFVSNINQVPGLPRHQLVAKTPRDFELRIYAQSVSSIVVKESLRRCQELFGNEIRLGVFLVKDEPRAKLRTVIPNPDARELGVVTSAAT